MNIIKQFFSKIYNMFRSAKMYSDFKKVKTKKKDLQRAVKNLKRKTKRQK